MAALCRAGAPLIEAAMREGNIASLDGLRRARAPQPAVLSFEAQIQWLIGEALVRQARLHWHAGDLAAARRDVAEARKSGPSDKKMAAALV